ncbi:ABC transporter permease [Fusobacterium sp. PH5-44]|uniref:ABC transporter permease n=1 Tax=unclassified Fusobacterium TaxID=2648384 RepID=UPI003D260F44
MRNFFKRNLIIFLILIIWYILASMKVWSSYILPSPVKVGKTFINMIYSGELFINIFVSIKRIIIGYSISFILSFILGIFSNVKKNIMIYLEKILEIFRNVPPISLIALLILWFGIGEISKIIIIILASFFPMYFNIKKGIKTCNIKLIEVGQSMNFTKCNLYKKIILPSAIPDILTGMRLGFGYSWRAIIGAEMIAASKGLGYLILDAQTMSRSDKVLVGVLVIGILGYICDKIFCYFINRFLYGGKLDV